MTPKPSTLSASNLLIGFAAGFLATLIFHQIMLAFLTLIGFVKGSIYVMRPVAPFGIPQVLSLSFWGGVWGVIFAAIRHRFPRGALYWRYALVFGAIFPTLVAWFIVSPIKGVPVAGGWQINRMLTGLLVNGAWGIGTALLFMLRSRIRKP